MRKYASTAHKFLDIVGSHRRIVVGSHAQIVIDDNRGNRMFISHVMWKIFIERHADIEQLTDLSSSSIQDQEIW